MTIAQMLTTIRFITNTNSTTFTDATMYRLASERHKQLIIELSKLKEGYLETTASQDLVNGTQAYALPSGMLRLKRAEIQYATGGVWRTVKIFDINEFPSQPNDTTTISGNYSKDAPYGDIMGNNLNLYPIPDAAVTNGLKLWYVALPSDFTATSDTPTAPADYHRLLCDLIATDVRQMKSELTASQALQEEASCWEMLKRQVSPRAIGEDQHAKPLHINYE